MWWGNDELWQREAGKMISNHHHHLATDVVLLFFLLLFSSYYNLVSLYCQSKVYTLIITSTIITVYAYWLGDNPLYICHLLSQVCLYTDLYVHFILFGSCRDDHLSLFVIHNRLLLSMHARL
jgi:hypothetical protein